MYTDTIADYLTRIRNANSAGHKVVDIPASNIKKEITKILFDQGFILSYKFEETENNQGQIKIALKYDSISREPVIKEIQRRRQNIQVKLQHVDCYRKDTHCIQGACRKQGHDA